MIYVSTGGVGQQPAWVTSLQFAEANLRCVELSGGVYDINQLSRLKALSRNSYFKVHNYFPPPSVPFVFNLASLDPAISSRSYEQIETAMQWALDLNSPVYSFHAGFLVDPQVTELGQRIQSRLLADRKEALNRFLEQVNLIAERAANLGVALLIENNPLSTNNYLEFSADPFLMTTAEECVYVMQHTPDNVNLLVDVAHLKVSARSLQFDAKDFLQNCHPWILAYHLSDNDGTKDSNDPITDESWFWPYLKTDLDYYSLEIYNVSITSLVQQHDLTQRKLCE